MLAGQSASESGGSQVFTVVFGVGITLATVAPPIYYFIGVRPVAARTAVFARRLQASSDDELHAYLTERYRRNEQSLDTHPSFSELDALVTGAIRQLDAAAPDPREAPGDLVTTTPHRPSDCAAPIGSVVGRRRCFRCGEPCLESELVCPWCGAVSGTKRADRRPT